ncbi:MAG: cation:proton antiporter [Halieaceae bacterium]
MSGVPDLVSGIMLLILVASFTAMLGTRLPRLPFTIALVLVGVLVEAAAPYTPLLAALADFRLTPELVLFVFLPTLVFESAHNLSVRRLQENILPVLILAVPGLLISTAVIGGIFYLFGVFDLIVCLLLGAILSATDPVAVISLFKQLGVPERLNVLVEGESLLNDATSLVLATLLIGIALSGEFSGSMVLAGIGDFLWVFFGGSLTGALLAFVACRLLGRIDALPAVEISLTTVLAYGSFIVAEHGLHVSGIMAVVAAGLVMGSYGRSMVSPGAERYLHEFWEYAAWLANALIFLLVGMELELLTYWQSLDLIGLVVVAMLVSRALVVFGLVPQLARLPDSAPVSRAYQMVMYWGGLRGAIAIAIVLSLPDFAARDTLIAVVMGAVLFTLVVQGLSIELLVKKLGLDLPEFAERLAQQEAELHAKEFSLASIDRLERGEFFSRRVATRLRDDAEQQISRLTGDIDELELRMSDEEAGRILSLRTLSREKTRYDELFRRGLIGPWAFRELTHNVEQQLDDAKHYGKLPGAAYRHAPLHLALMRLLRILGGVPLLGRLVEQRQYIQVMRDYDVSWARHRAAGSVLGNLDEIAAENGISGTIAERLRVVYQRVSTQMQREIEQVSENYPEFVEAAQERLGQRLLLISAQDAIDRVSELGIVQHGVADAIKRQHESELRAIQRSDLSHFLEIGPSELLNKVPMFAELAPEEFAAIIPGLRKRNFPKGERVIRQGGRGDSLFMIARGIVSVVDAAGDNELVQLFPGDCFGEAALLHGTPRNASVYAVTPCSLYELSQQDWREVCRRHPNIEAAIESIDRQRKEEGVNGR